MAASGVCGTVGPRASPAGVATMGLVGVGLLSMSDESRLDEWLLVRLRHCLNSEKQCWHARLGVPRGLKLASWSRGTSKLLCESQKILPHFRQWCRRVK